MSRQPSASSTKRLLQCSHGYSYEESDAGDDGEDSVEASGGDEPARYGSAFHELLEGAPLELGARFKNAKAVALAARKWRVDGQELAEHVRASLPKLQKWLSGKNPWGKRFDLRLVEREKSYAILGRTGERRRISLPRAADHFYEDLRNGEIAMTSDLETTEAGGLMLDHKTGEDVDHFTRPSRNRQLRTLALATNAGTVAVFHAHRRGLPMIYAEEISDKTKEKHRARLKSALSLVGKGYMRRFTKEPEDSECAYCPARPTCPAQTAEVLRGAAALVNGATALAKVPKGGLTRLEDVTRLHAFFSEFHRLENLAKPLIRQRVREAWAANEIPILEDGRVLEFVERTYERLSKSRIVEKLGRKEAERVFEMLRKAGALAAVTQEELHARPAERMNGRA